METRGTWLADFNPGKTQLVLFDQSNNTGAIDATLIILVGSMSFQKLFLDIIRTGRGRLAQVDSGIHCLLNAFL